MVVLKNLWHDNGDELKRQVFKHKLRKQRKIVNKKKKDKIQKVINMKKGNANTIQSVYNFKNQESIEK